MVVRVHAAALLREHALVVNRRRGRGRRGRGLREGEGESSVVTGYCERLVQYAIPAQGIRENMTP